MLPSNLQEVIQVETEQGFYIFPELIHIIEEGRIAFYNDPANYGRIRIFKELKKFPEGSFVYYTVQWGEDPEEARSWSALESHFERLDSRIYARGWQIER